MDPTLKAVIKYRYHTSIIAINNIYQEGIVFLFLILLLLEENYNENFEIERK